MVEIIPSILTSDPSEARALLSKVEGLFQRVQIDIVDGQFESNRTIDPSALEDVETSAKLDFHLMTKEPTDWVERAFRAGGDRIIGQIEHMTSQRDFVGKVAEAGVSVGLAIDIDTPVSQIEPEILTSLDVVLVMSVKAGRGGQEFKVRSLKKVKELVEIKKNDPTPFRICVDGGEILSTVDDTHFVGADEIVIGRIIFEGDIAENKMKFENAAHNLDPIK